MSNQDARAVVCFVCSGNLCRSPFAEGLFRRLLEDAALLGRVAVTSAGTLGQRGRGAEPHGIAAAAEHGVDLAGHRSRPLTPALVAESAAILGMAAEHAALLRKTYPAHRAKIFLFGSFPERHLAGPEIADPMGKPLSAYQAAYAEIAEIALRIVPHFATLARG
ncbi:MAG: hypothetical protein L0Z55_00440 [Planctomycetes bacterium]|nr:hypothetical protein [Planctomycetota bacterium]